MLFKLPTKSCLYLKNKSFTYNTTSYLVFFKLLMKHFNFLFIRLNFTHNLVDYLLTFFLFLFEIIFFFIKHSRKVCFLQLAFLFQKDI